MCCFKILQAGFLFINSCSRNSAPMAYFFKISELPFELCGLNSAHTAYFFKVRNFKNEPSGGFPVLTAYFFTKSMSLNYDFVCRQAGLNTGRCKVGFQSFGNVCRQARLSIGRCKVSFKPVGAYAHRVIFANDSSKTCRRPETETLCTSVKYMPLRYSAGPRIFPEVLCLQLRARCIYTAEL